MKSSVLQRITALVIGLALWSGATAAADMKLSVTLDSAYVLMGKATPLHISAVGSRDDAGKLLIPKDSLNAKVEILRILKADTIDHGNNRMEINQDLLLQSFDSGDYRLNPIMYVSGGGETISSNRLVLRVMPVAGDSITLNDFAGTADVNRNWIDYIPDFLYYYWMWILIGLIAIGGAVAAYIMMRKKKDSKSAADLEPKLSPYDQAITDLTALKSQKLCEKGQEKEFYSTLTEILRVYLYRRFGINAMEMTSSQIRGALYSNPATRLPKKYMDQVLEIADFVKFAKVRPLPDDNVNAFESAMTFVEDTKPQPVVVENADSDADNNTLNS